MFAFFSRERERTQFKPRNKRFAKTQVPNLKYRERRRGLLDCIKRLIVNDTRGVHLPWRPKLMLLNINSDLVCYTGFHNLLYIKFHAL